MRIFLPLAAEDRSAMRATGRRLELPAARPVWAVTDGSRTDRGDRDEEDLEYDALQDAVHVALEAAEPRSRALVIAADVPVRTLEEGTADQGAFGAVLRAATTAEIASFHVTELVARAAEADDTDPALLWFDASEGVEALAYLDASARD